MAKTKAEWLAVLCKAPKEEPEQVPLLNPDGEPLDASEYWLKFRRPTGVEFDELTAMQSRRLTETSTVVDRDDFKSTEMRQIEYTDDRQWPLIERVIGMGLIIDAQFPKFQERTKDYGVHKWKDHDSGGNIAFVRSAPWLLHRMLIDAISKEIFAKTYEDVVSEGEDLADEPDTSESETQDSQEQL